MKKINLSIPKPCHENWNQMTPAEQGRFCGSCQKTVVDFTHMSDRELAAFFKKPAGSVCGRFHQDQLNRDITIPKKRIPWLRYFFHIAWPAFLVMLKSCGPKERHVVGEPFPSLSISGNEVNNGTLKDVILGGIMLPEDSIAPPVIGGQVVMTETSCSFEIMGDIAIDVVDPEKVLDSMALQDKPIGEVVAIDTTSPIEASIVPQEVIGKVAPRSSHEESDSVANAQLLGEDSAYIDMDTVTVVASGTGKRRTISCGLSPTVIRTISHTEEGGLESDTHSVLAYPNPSRPGSVLNVKFAEKKAQPLSIQLLTSGGQRVLHKNWGKADDASPATLQLPNNLTSGVYFIQVLYANGAKDKVSVLVSQ